MSEKPVIVGAAMLTAEGAGLERNFAALLAGRTAFAAPRHFGGGKFHCGIISRLDDSTDREISRAEVLLALLHAETDGFDLPPGAPLYLATTVGAIDRLERGISGDGCRYLLERAAALWQRQNKILISGACASAQLAVAEAGRSIVAGETDYALVVGCDICSEFVCSGFQSLGALSARKTCRPYDTERDGLLLGEGAGAVLLASPEAARRDRREILGRLAGWGESADAIHATAPDLSGNGLALASLRAFERAGWRSGDIGCVLGHGTGTSYNDEAEIAAIARWCGDDGVPLFSVKGNWGHSLGAAGILQMITGLVVLRHGEIPPQAGLKQPAPGAEKMVSRNVRKLGKCRGVLSLNAGFGGINSALALEVEL